VNDQRAAEIKALEKEMIKVSILETPGTILLGLAFYAKFAANGKPFHPLLADESVLMGMFVAGGSIALWGGLRFMMIAKRRKALENG